MKGANIIVRKFRQKEDDPKAEQWMIKKFQKESETLLRKLKWLSYYKKPSELRKLAKLRKRKKIKKFMKEQEV